MRSYPGGRTSWPGSNTWNRAGRCTLDDQTTKLKLRRSLVWHHVLPATKASSALSQPPPDNYHLPTMLWGKLALTVSLPNPEIRHVLLSTMGSVLTMYPICPISVSAVTAFTPCRDCATTRNSIANALHSLKNRAVGGGGAD